nr:hypothetical protein [Alkaliphilus metalliredigens]
MIMLLREKDLKKYLFSRRITISDGLKQELLNEYGSPVEDDEGHIFEYTEQDIYEQIRKVIRDKN